MASTIIDVAKRREFPRIPFRATVLVIDPSSAEVVFAHTTELSRFGCFVETPWPLPQRSRVHVEITDGVDIFSASGRVAYVTGDGMGIAFGLVESKSYEILAKWLMQVPVQAEG
jgi:hypothetical protein